MEEEGECKEKKENKKMQEERGETGRKWAACVVTKPK